MQHSYPARLAAASLLLTASMATSMAQAKTVELVWEITPDQHRLTTTVNQDVQVTPISDALKPFEMRYRLEIGNQMHPFDGPMGIQLFAPLKAFGASHTPYSETMVNGPTTPSASTLSAPGLPYSADAAFWQDLLADGGSEIPSAFQTLSMHMGTSWRTSEGTTSQGGGYSRDIVIGVQGALVQPLHYQSEDNDGAAFIGWLQTLLGREGSFQEACDNWRNELHEEDDTLFWRNENRTELVGGKAVLRSVSVVPEPSAWALVMAGLIAVPALGRRQRAAAMWPRHHAA